MRVDWVSIIEAAYRVDLDQNTWLSGVLEACRQLVACKRRYDPDGLLTPGPAFFAPG